MTRTWQQNSDAINGLWPQCQWTDEEIDLWREDLSGLDQNLLFEALREVKRSKESLYPQLVWVHQAYRKLSADRLEAARHAAPKAPAFSGDRLEIDPAESRRLAAEIAAEIDAALPGDVDAILAKITSLTDRMDAVAASRLAWRASARRNATPDTVRAAPASGRGFVDARIVDGDHDVERRRAEQLRILKEIA
jgi:hypothetical protein